MLNQLMRYIPLASLVEKEFCGKILEVGSGIRGIGMYLTAEIVVGIDTDFSGLGDVRTKNFYPVKATGKTLPFRDNSFDIVVCSDTLEHVPPLDRERFIKELYRVAKRKVYLAFPIKETSEGLEKKLVKIYKLFRKDLPVWLSDHIAKGLPEEREISRFLRENKIFFKVIPNENNLIHLGVMIIDEFIFPQCSITNIISPNHWKYSEHAFRENLIRLVFSNFRYLPMLSNFGSTVRKIFILDKNSRE